MKIISTLFLSIIFVAMSGSAVFAAPDNTAKGTNNPQVVAFYQDGTHGVVGENATHTGTDLVMQSGQSGNFQQWFTGTSQPNGVEGDHSVWKSVGNATDCSQLGNGWVFVANANQSWGSYLQPGNYCVHTNDSSGK